MLFVFTREMNTLYDANVTKVTTMADNPCKIYNFPIVAKLLLPCSC
jgi:hypothetical protein